MEKNIEALENVRQELVNNHQSLHHTINESLKGTDFKVGVVDIYFFYITVELVITGKDKSEKSCWNNLTFRLDEKDHNTEKGVKFTSYIGTSGSFDLDDNSVCSLNNFYINVGKVLGNKELLGNIKNTMLVHAAAIRELDKKMNELTIK